MFHKIICQDSNQVYFELDLTNPYTIASLTSCQLLPRGLNLSQVLPPGIYDRLRDHLDWVRQEMQSWITADQAGRGLYADYLYNAITGRVLPESVLLRDFVRISYIFNHTYMDV